MTTEQMEEALRNILEMNQAQRIYLTHVLQALRGKTAHGFDDWDEHSAFHGRRQ
jgi:hypothetical protein